MSQPITKQPTPSRWRELHFRQMASVEAARTVFGQLCSDGALGTIVIESRASRSGVRWLVGAHPSKVARTSQVISSQLDVHVSSSRAGRVNPDLVGLLDAKGQLLSTDPGRVMASVRSLFALAAHLEGGEEICPQLLIGRRITPPVAPRRTEPGWLNLSG